MKGTDEAELPQGCEPTYEPWALNEAERRHNQLRRELREMMMQGDERFRYWNELTQSEKVK